MTDLRKAAEMALVALDHTARSAVEQYVIEQQVVTFLKQALAQHEQVSIEPPDYVEPITFDYHEGWEEGFKAGVESVKNKKESTPSNVDSLLHGGDGNYIKQAQPEQEPEHPLDIYERAYFAGKQDGIDEALAQHEKKWVGLTDKDFQYQQPAEILTMKYTEALLKERNI